MRNLMLIIIVSTTFSLWSGQIIKRWSLEQSPIFIDGNITIPSNTLLKIEPGVEIIFTGDHSFRIDGYIEAIGTYEERIVFKGNGESTWSGIIFDFQKSPEDTLRSLLSNCVIKNAYSKFDPSNPGSGGNGGGVQVEKGNKVTISDCIIEDNDADGYGGGCYVNNSDVWMINCIVRNNEADFGGGLYINKSNMRLINNTIIDNVANQDGGAAYHNDSNGEYVNNIIWGNTAQIGMQIYLNDDMSDPNFFNCNVEKGVEDFSGAGSGVFFTGKYVNCISSEPMLERVACDFYELSSNSPCINRGTTDPEIVNLPLYDISGEKRIVGALVDIGSIEYKNVLSIKDENEVRYSALDNYPNPFNSTTTLNYVMSISSEVKITIYDAIGRTIKEIYMDAHEGENNLKLNFEGLPSGVYYIQLHSKNVTAMKKIHYLK
ncbi:MAG: T9SS type A sorting domain-containing protein [Candidatus Delongbacteria bacterium]|nr:T9SS type A sorting domain-containing protein [Candidatus Delongbacteria bacterium]MBN2833415.1 T9SS type A sorting domain-containing protein [Candidatus Delongbacteria bacterium]